jgi:hypothetical protein
LGKVRPHGKVSSLASNIFAFNVDADRSENNEMEADLKLGQMFDIQMKHEKTVQILASLSTFNKVRHEKTAHTEKTPIKQS